MIRLKQALVVEGRYDKNTLSQIVDAPIFVTNGFGIFKDRKTLALLRKVAEKRGLIVLTDSDGAGLVIRNRLKSAIPPEHLLHAYIPDVPGKEKRKSAPGKEGKLGVEGMPPDVLVAALRRAGATVLCRDDSVQTDLCAQGCFPPSRRPITKNDFYELGLSGRPNSGTAREALKRALDLPERLSANGLLETIQILFDSPEAFRAFWEEQKQTTEEG